MAREISVRTLEDVEQFGPVVHSAVAKLAPRLKRGSLALATNAIMVAAATTAAACGIENEINMVAVAG